MLNFDEIFTEEEKETNIYHMFGFNENPFPEDATNYAKEVFHNQEEAIDILKRALTNFATDRHRQIVLIEGSYRTGKTHLLKYFFENLKEKAPHSILIWYAKDYGNNFMDFYKILLVDAISETQINNFINRFKKDNVSGEKVNPYLKQALNSVLLEKEEKREEKLWLFYKWLQGFNLTKTEQRELRIESNLSFSGLAVKVLHDFLILAKKYADFKGLILFLDEFEKLFTKSYSATQRSNYLYAFRNFIDEFNDIGLFIAAAILGKTLGDLKRDYEALYHRLTGKSAKIRLLATAEEAIAFARVFLDYFHKKFLMTLQNIPREKLKKVSYPITELQYQRYKYRDKVQKILLTQDRIENIFLHLEKKPEAQRGVRQGFFIKGLREEAEKRVSELP